MNGEEIDLSYEFGPFRLEPATRRLLREGEPLPLTPKAFDTLLFLVQNRERVVEKEEVLRRLWPDTVVEESNLAQNVFTLRKTLGDSPDGARFIATVPRRGYRFVAPVTPSRNALLAAAVADATTAAPVRRGAGPRLAKALLVLVAVVALPFAGYLAGHRKRPPDPEQPTPDEPLNKDQQKAMHASFNKLDIKDRAERLHITQAIIGRDIASSNDLTKREASTLLDALAHCKTRDHVEALVQMAEQQRAGGEDS